MHLWTVIYTVSWTAELLCLLSVSSDELSHTGLKLSLILFTESPLTTLLPTVRSWTWAQGWVRERAGQRDLSLFLPCELQHGVHACRICCPVILCLNAHCSPAFIYHLLLQQRTQVWQDIIFSSQGKTFTQKWLCLKSKYVSFTCFLCYIVIIVVVMKDKIPCVCNSHAEQVCPIC